MRFKATRPAVTQALPKNYHMFTSRIEPRLQALSTEIVPAIKSLQKRGILGGKEAQDIVKHLASVQRAAKDLSARERRAFGAQLRKEFSSEIEGAILESISINPDAIRFVPSFTLRHRLRQQANEVLDFVDTSIEALKRLRYNGYIKEDDYVRDRRMLEYLPKFRSDLLAQLERYGDA